jgi:hypothetical protein
MLLFLNPLLWALLMPEPPKCLQLQLFDWLVGTRGMFKCVSWISPQFTCVWRTHAHSDHNFLPYLQVLYAPVCSASYSSPSTCIMCEVLEHICVWKHFVWNVVGGTKHSVWSSLTLSCERHHFCTVVFNSMTVKSDGAVFTTSLTKCCHGVMICIS